MPDENDELLALAAELGLPGDDAESVEDTEDGHEQGHDEMSPPDAD